MMGDTISRQEATSIPILPKEHRKTFKSVDDAFETGWNEALSCVNMLPSAQPEIIRCKDFKHSEHWYRDKRRCFLWVEDGIDVFDDGFCNYAER